MDNPSTSRQFIDLIFNASARWANWNPTYEIKVGDYGKVDKQTGEFNRRGNIYEDEITSQLVKDHPPIQAAREDVYIATSGKVKRSDLESGPETDAPELANASIKGQWAFGPKRGALLIMAQPRSSYIPRHTILKDLAKVETLKDMSLVTEVFLCPAYSLYLSSGNGEVVNLALVGSFLVPQASGVTVGGQIEGKWWVQNAAGLFRSALDQDGNDNFAPLYMLKGIRKTRGLFSRRGEPPRIREGDDLWCDVQTPWDPLDDEGNEDVFEDTVFD